MMLPNKSKVTPLGSIYDMQKTMQHSAYIAVILLLGFSSPIAAEETAQMDDVTVFADTSLTIPLTRIARSYSSQKQLSVSAVFSSSKDQVERIEDGEEADIFISAKPIWINRLQQKGLIDVYSRTMIASNRLVIAGSETSKISEKTGDDGLDGDELRALLPITNPDFQFSLGDPEYLAEGPYTFQALNNPGLSSDVEPFYSFFRTTREMLRSTTKYDAYSAVFKTDALLYPNIRIVGAFPEKSHDPILYQAVVVAGENMEGARTFLSYLQSDEALEILTNYGFELVE